ncbi:MAG: DegV family protein [Anaerolineaceae bacterium]|nr:DegV family protein [Anaerolineaceae bacterium]
MIKILADTTSTLSVDEAKKLGVYYLPQIIVFGEKSYRDDTEISTVEFLDKLRKSTSLPKTAAPPPALYTPIYEEIVKNGDSALVLTPSSKVSGTFRSATVAAQDFQDADITVIDTKLIGPGFGTVVRLTVEWSQQGVSMEEITKRIEDYSKRSVIYLYVDTLEYLHKGGRIGAAKALAGSVLQIKPILLFRDGQINQFESQRTKKRAISRIIELVQQECPASPNSHLAILEADAMDDAIELRNSFSSYLNLQDIQICDLPPAIIVHAGPGVLAASFFK